QASSLCPGGATGWKPVPRGLEPSRSHRLEACATGSIRRMRKLRVAVLMGGRSTEREVSLWTGEQVLKALDPARYEVISVDTAALGMRRAASRERPAEGGAAALRDPF